MESQRDITLPQITLGVVTPPPGAFLYIQRSERLLCTLLPYAWNFKILAWEILYRPWLVPENDINRQLSTGCYFYRAILPRSSNEQNLLSENPSEAGRAYIYIVSFKDKEMEAVNQWIMWLSDLTLEPRDQGLLLWALDFRRFDSGPPPTSSLPKDERSTGPTGQVTKL